MTPIEEARAAFLATKVPPKTITFWRVFCASGEHELIRREDRAPTVAEAQAIEECPECLRMDRDEEDVSERVVSPPETWQLPSPTMVDAVHLGAALAEVDRLTVERNRVDPLSEEVRMLMLTRQEAIEVLAAELERARRTLAVEQGREGPPGWVGQEVSTGGVLPESRVRWVRRAGAGRFTPAVWRGHKGWQWQTNPDGAGRREGTAPTALEAIEACDAAMVGR